MIKLILRQKRHLEAQRRRYDALSRFNDTLLFEYDVSADRIVFTPNATERLDLDERSLEGLPAEYYVQHLIHPDDRAALHREPEFSNLVLNKIYHKEARFRCKNGKYAWFSCQFKSIENHGDSASRIVGKLVDISNQRKQEQRLQRAALKDLLTGVYNRAGEVLIRNQLEQDSCGLLFMLDLDDFKNINDTHGHAAGDALLVGVAQILKNVFRPDDIIARIGGDEFVAFLSGTDDSKIAETKAAEILQRIDQLHIPEIDQPVSVSIGVASAPGDGSSYDALIRSADQAMYSVKQQSKKGFALHSPAK